MPQPITALHRAPDTGGVPAVTADGGWVGAGRKAGLGETLSLGWKRVCGRELETDESAERAKNVREAATMAYGIRPINLVLPQADPLVVRLKAADYISADYRRRQEIRSIVRDILTTEAPTLFSRTLSAHVNLAVLRSTEYGEDRYTDARTVIAYFNTLKQGIDGRITLNHFGLWVVSWWILAGMTAWLVAGNYETWLIATLTVVSLVAVIHACLKAGWKRGYNQALWHCAEGSTYDSRDRTRVAAETARISAENARAKAAAEAKAAEFLKTRRMAFDLPRQPVGEGYLYVVGFSTGTVKVGLSEDPKTRLGNHRSWSAAFGVQVANYWISPSHVNFRDNETRLINACAKVSTRSRREYFHEVGYKRAVQFANELTYFTSELDDVNTSVEGVWA